MQAMTEIPQCLKGKIKIPLKLSQLNKIIRINGMTISGFIQKMEREGAPFNFYRSVDGVKRYKPSDLIAKCKARGYKIYDLVDYERIKELESLKKLADKNYKDINRLQMQKYETYYNNLSFKLTNKGILSHKEIIETGKLFSEDECIGIYFLIKNNEVVYVGQSVNVFNRIGQHRYVKDFDGFKYINCKKSELDILESIYIHFLNPKLNGFSGCSERTSAPIKFEELLKRIEIRSA